MAEDVVFADTQIGRGLKPLAQHGTVVVGADGTFSMYGTDGALIVSAPINQVSAKRLLITGGQTVSLKVQGEKYNCSPGWGDRGSKGVVGVSSAAKALVSLIKAGGPPQG